MNRPTLLVLGASRYQLEVIERAKQLGYAVVTVDNEPTNPGHALADASFNVDTTSLDRVLEVAKTSNARGIVAPCTDVAVVTAAYVAERLGLPSSLPVQSARILTSKIRFREWLRAESLSHPRFASIAERLSTNLHSKSQENSAFLTECRATPAKRLILKPERSSGSKGIFIVNGMSELEERLPTTLSFSPDRVAIVEELIDGHQGTCEGIFVDGKVALAVLTDRVTAPSPYVVTAGHLVPTLLTDDAGSKVISLIADVFERLQIRNAMFDCDYVLDDKQDKAYLLELTPRLGGNSLTRLVRTALGVDMAEAAISLACGRQLHLLATGARPTPTAQLILGVRRAGLLTYDELGAASLGRESWVHSLSFDMAIGRPVQAFINGRTRVGEATIVAATREELNARVEEFYSRLRLDIQLEPASR